MSLLLCSVTFCLTTLLRTSLLHHHFPWLRSLFQHLLGSSEVVSQSLDETSRTRQPLISITMIQVMLAGHHVQMHISAHRTSHSFISAWLMIVTNHNAITNVQFLFITLYHNATWRCTKTVLKVPFNTVLLGSTFQCAFNMLQCLAIRIYLIDLTYLLDLLYFIA